MATISYFAIGQMVQLGRGVRKALASLRRQRLTLSERRLVPTRNESLDPILLELQLCRLRLELQVLKLAGMAQLGAEEGEVLAKAKQILGDALELADLIIWFGANAPDEQVLLGRINGEPEPKEY